MPVIAFIALGSNLGDRRANIMKAIELLKSAGKVEIMKVSSLHETEPEGGPPQGKFLDGAAEIRTELSPHELLAHLKQVEQETGRRPSGVRWGPREIDLDILLYGDLTVNDPDLTIPHPLLHLRAFMAGPLAEIAPGAFHPVIRKTASGIFEGLSGKKI
ncbi:MAG: 2-amino-4-hydroxy-6-hydroxymethyldihydropteridine diphosphokinase [Candidatus Omnitrophica bacterium]|nr:2-amino-4-hydroxy-6-hydroxymethyldihydropteridine diphosphokinase [Candidatus Omnitrophota bacterium]